MVREADETSETASLNCKAVLAKTSHRSPCAGSGPSFFEYSNLMESFRAFKNLYILGIQRKPREHGPGRGAQGARENFFTRKKNCGVGNTFFAEV